MVRISRTRQHSTSGDSRKKLPRDTSIAVVFSQVTFSGDFLSINSSNQSGICLFQALWKSCENRVGKKRETAVSNPRPSMVEVLTTFSYRPTREVKEAWSSTECISAEETEEIEETQEKTTIIDISEENIKEENIREVNIKEENIKEDTIKEDNIKEENIKEDNIKEDNIKEDNIREDNIREDNIKEDNIRPNKCKWWIPKCLRRRSRSSVRNIKKDSKETESRPQKLFRLFSCCISKSVTE
ncbi:uncharacterized protein LOC142243857 [Anomaloglossus baeobatrachus]|uniref:uncharacterized protein LOC142243857 n=1 Tax=Anomaloglossus baeobatrachus TaxID=238106 RepID=UPI003F5005D1